MRNKLNILPILYLFLFLIGFVCKSVFSSQPMIAYVLWISAFGFFVVWILKSFNRLKELLSRRSSRYGASSFVSVFLVILMIFGMAFLSSKPRLNLSWDVTRDGTNTLSDQSIKVIEALNRNNIRPNLLAFFTSDDKKAEFKQMITLYLQKGGQFNVEYIDPQSDPTRAISENITAPDTVLFKSNLNEVRINDFSEEEITNAFLTLSKQKQKSVFFTVGHGERSLNSNDEEALSIVRDELSSERINVDQLDLLESEIPNEGDLLIIAGPRYDFKEPELDKLKAYLNQGRSLLVMIDAMAEVPKLGELLEPYGIKPRSDFVILRPDDPRSQLLGQNNAILTKFDEMAPPTRDYAKRSSIALMVSDARSLELSEENQLKMDVIALAETGEINIAIDGVRSASDLKNIDDSRVKEGQFVIAAMSVGQVGGKKIASHDETDRKSDMKDSITSHDHAASKELRIAIFGASSLISNHGVQRAENIDLFLNVVNYLIRDEDYIAIRPKDLEASKLDMSTTSSQFSLLFFSFIYPLLFLGLGLMQWMRRRRS